MSDLTSYPRCWFCTIADDQVAIIENHTLDGVEERRSGPRFQHPSCAANRAAYEEAQVAKRAADLERMRGRHLSKTSPGSAARGDDQRPPAGSSGQHGSAAVLATFSPAADAGDRRASRDHGTPGADHDHDRPRTAGRVTGTATRAAVAGTSATS